MPPCTVCRCQLQEERYSRNEALAKQVEAHRRVNEAIAVKLGFKPKDTEAR